MSKANLKLVKSQKNLNKNFPEQNIIDSTKMDLNKNSSNKNLYFVKNNLVDSNSLVLKNQINCSINQFSPNQFIDLANLNSLIGTNESTDAMNSLIQMQCEKDQNFFNLKNFSINHPNFNITQPNFNINSKLPNINKLSDSFNFNYLNTRQPIPKPTTVFVCNVCGQDLPTLEAFDEHEATNHPNVLCTYYETDNQKIEVDSKIKNTTINQNFSLNNLKKVIENTKNVDQVSSKKEIKSKKVENKIKNETVTNYNCTKCKANFSEISKFHEHILDCATNLEEQKKSNKKKPIKSDIFSKNLNNEEIKIKKKVSKVIVKGKLNTSLKEPSVVNLEKKLIEVEKNFNESNNEVLIMNKNLKEKNSEKKFLNEEIAKKDQASQSSVQIDLKKVSKNNLLNKKSFKNEKLSKNLNKNYLNEKFNSTKISKDKFKNAKAIKGKYIKNSKFKNKRLKTKEINISDNKGILESNLIKNEIEKMNKTKEKILNKNLNEEVNLNKNEKNNFILHENLLTTESNLNVNKIEEIGSKSLRTRKVFDKKSNKSIKNKSLIEKTNKKNNLESDKTQIENQQVVNIINDKKNETSSLIKKNNFSGESILQKSDPAIKKEISIIRQEYLSETKKKKSLLNKKPLKAFNISTIKLNSTSNDIFSVTTIGTNRIIINKNILSNKFNTENSLNQNDLLKKDMKNDEDENSEESSLFYEQYLQSKIPKNIEEIHKKVKSLSIKNYRLKNDYYSKKNIRLNRMRKPYKSVLNNKNSIKNYNETIKERLRKKSDKRFKKKELKQNKLCLIKKKELKKDLDFQNSTIDRSQSKRKLSDSFESQNLVRRSSRISNIKSYNETDEKIDDNFVCWKCNEEFKEKKLLTKHSFNCKKSKQRKLDLIKKEKIDVKDKKINSIDLNMNWQCSKCLYQYSYEANYRKHLLSCKGVLKQDEKSESLLVKKTEDLIKTLDTVKDNDLIPNEKLSDLKPRKETDNFENNKDSNGKIKSLDTNNLAIKNTSLQYHTCPFCHMGFTYTANYRKHVESKACTGTKHTEIVKKELIDSKIILPEASTKKNSSKLEKKYFVCKFCQKRILSKIGLIKHLSVHTKKTNNTEMITDNSQDNNVTNRLGKVKSIIKQRIIDLLKK